jgi:small-conductance mechanosensitive channel
MSETSTKILWVRAILTGIAAVVIAFIVLMLVVTIYAFVLAFRERGAPDTEMIGQFAEWLGMWLSPLLTIILAFFGAMMVARKAGGQFLLHGILVGMVIVILSFLETKIFGGSLDMKEAIYLLFYLVSAGLGGFRSVPKHRN